MLRCNGNVRGRQRVRLAAAPSASGFRQRWRSRSVRAREPQPHWCQGWGGISASARLGARVAWAAAGLWRGTTGDARPASERVMGSACSLPALAACRPPIDVACPADFLTRAAGGVPSHTARRAPVAAEPEEFLRGKREQGSSAVPLATHHHDVGHLRPPVAAIHKLETDGSRKRGPTPAPCAHSAAIVASAILITIAGHTSTRWYRAQSRRRSLHTPTNARQSRPPRGPSATRLSSTPCASAAAQWRSHRAPWVAVTRRSPVTRRASCPSEQVRAALCALQGPRGARRVTHSRDGSLLVLGPSSFAFGVLCVRSPALPRCIARRLHQARHAAPRVRAGACCGTRWAQRCSCVANVGGLRPPCQRPLSSSRVHAGRPCPPRGADHRTCALTWHSLLGASSERRTVVAGSSSRGRRPADPRIATTRGTSAATFPAL